MGAVNRRGWMQRYRAAVLAVAGVTVLKLIWLWTLGTPVPDGLYFTAIAIGAWQGGWWGGLLATLLAIAAAGLLLSPPASSLEISLFLLEGLGLSGVVAGALQSPSGRSPDSGDAFLESQLRPIIEVVNQGVWLLDAHQRTRYVNRRMATWLGYDPSEMLGRPLGEFMDALGLEDSRYPLRQPNCYGFCWHRRDGTSFWGLVSTQPLFSEAGDYQGAIVLVSNMGEWRQAEAQLRNSEARLRQAIVNAPVPALIFAEDGEILYLSDRLLRLTGYRREEIATLADWTRLAYGDQAEIMQARIQAILQSETPTEEGEATVQTRSGERRIWDFCSTPLDPLPDGRRLGLSMAADITERKATEEALQHLNQRLEERVRARTAQLEAANQELEVFAYSVSHDLRAPIRHITGFVQLLQKQLPADALDEMSRHYLSVIDTTTQQAGELIDDLLAFSRTSRVGMRLQRVDLNDLVVAVQQSLGPEIGDRAIRWQIDSLPTVQGDAQLLRQAFYNLLSNAVKYTRREAVADIRITAERQGAFTQIAIADNGIGFDMQYAPKLFGIFQRLHCEDDFPGTGIGLAHVQRIVHRHGGHIWAQGKPDQGATFYLTLPLVEVNVSRLEV